MIRCMILNNFRELTEIIVTKLNISENMASKITKVYYLASFIFGILMAYFFINIRVTQIYFLILSSWYIISLPKYNFKIKYMNLINRIIKSIAFIPLVLISILINPIISIIIISISILINKFFYCKIINGIKSKGGNYFLLICALMLVSLNNIWIFIICFLLSAIFYFKINQYTNQKIFIDGMISFLGLFMVKEYIVKYDKFGLVLIGLYIIVITKNAVLCQQEQFFNLKKSLLNLEIEKSKKLDIIYRYDYKLILSYIIIHFPLTFVVIYYKTNNILNSTWLSLLISILQNTLYFNFLLYGVIKFIKSKTLICNISDFMAFRYSPLFVLSSMPLISIYYLYLFFELKVIIVFALLILVIIFTSFFSRFKFKKILLSIVEE